jgi:hypothetical protein
MRQSHVAPFQAFDRVSNPWISDRCVVLVPDMKRSKKVKVKSKKLHLVPGRCGHMEGGKHELLVVLKKNAM